MRWFPWSLGAVLCATLFAATLWWFYAILCFGCVGMAVKRLG